MGYLALVAIGDGLRRALAAVAGVAVGLALIGTLAALGAATLIETVPALRAALRYGGIAYMLWLAIVTWRGSDAAASDGADEFASFRRGLVTNLLNPKAGLFFATVLPSFIAIDDAPVLVQNLALVAIYVGIATLVHAAIAILAAASGAGLRDGSRAIVLRRVLALGMVGVAAWIGWTTR